MAVRYVIFDGELVSREWSYVLHDMRKDGVSFWINEGHRTIARQQYFWNCYVCQCCNNGNLAARPTPWAPHIRIGSINHAIDFSNPEAVMAWLRRKGLNPTRPAGAGTSRWEPWHIEVSAAALQAYARRHPRTDIYDTLPRHIEFAVRRLFMHRNQAIDEAKTGKGKKYRKAVKWRNFWRKRLEAMLRRAKKARTKRIIRQALDYKKRS